MRLILEIPSSKMPVEWILSVGVIFQIPPGLAWIARVVDSVVDVTWAIGVAESFIALVGTGCLSQAEDVVAALWIAVHGEGMRVISCHDDQSLIQVHVLQCCCHRVIQFCYLAHCQLRVVLVMSKINFASFDLENGTFVLVTFPFINMDIFSEQIHTNNVRSQTYSFGRMIS